MAKIKVFSYTILNACIFCKGCALLLRANMVEYRQDIV